MTDEAATPSDEPGGDEDHFVPTREDGRPLTPFELRIYARAGLGPAEAQTWVRHGVEPYQAEAFRRAGFGTGDDDAEKAGQWIHDGVSGVKYADWIGRGRDPHKELEAERAAKDRQAKADAAKAQEQAEAERRRTVAADAAARRLEEQVLIGVSDIARLATHRSGGSQERALRRRKTPREGLNLANVTHWRRSDPTFPAPVVGGRSPQFKAIDVLTWLRESGRLAPGAPSSTWYWDQTVKALPAELASVEPGGDRPTLRCFVAAVVTLAAELDARFLGTDHDGAPLPIDLGAARALVTAKPPTGDPADAERGLVLTAGVASIDRQADHGADYDKAYGLLRDALEVCRGRTPIPDSWELLDRALALLAGRSGAAAVTEQFLAELMTALLPDDVTSVLDPACGEGEVLAHLAHQHRADRLVGVDVDPAALCVARARFGFFAGHRQPTFHHADVLRADPVADERFDAVVTDPVFGKGRQPATWLRLATGHLTSDGWALVVIPDPLLRSDRSVEEGIADRRLAAVVRSLGEVIADRRLAAVIRLPSSVRAAERRPLALCVLTGTDRSFDRIALVDLTRMRIRDADPDRTTSTAPAVDPARLGNLVRDHWLADPTTPTGQPLHHLWSPKHAIASTVVDADTAALANALAALRAGAADRELRAAAAQLRKLLAERPDLETSPDLDEALEALERYLER